MVEKDKDTIDPSTFPVYTKEEQYRFVEYLRNLAYDIAAHYEGEEDRLRRAALRGLPDAVRLFKGEKCKEFKFSTYVSWFMKEGVEKEIGFKGKKANT